MVHVMFKDCVFEVFRRFQVFQLIRASFSTFLSFFSPLSPHLVCFSEKDCQIIQQKRAHFALNILVSSMKF